MTVEYQWARSVLFHAYQASYWPFMRGILWWAVDFPHKGPCGVGWPCCGHPHLVAYMVTMVTGGATPSQAGVGRARHLNEHGGTEGKSGGAWIQQVSVINFDHDDIMTLKCFLHDMIAILVVSTATAAPRVVLLNMWCNCAAFLYLTLRNPIICLHFLVNSSLVMIDCFTVPIFHTLFTM